MTRSRILTALVALIAISVIGSVVHLETSAAGPRPTPTTRTATSTTTTSTTTAAPTTTTPTGPTLPTTATVPPTIVPPTTMASTTVPPTTVVPSTVAPTTVAPTTVPPTTVPPPERSTVAVVVSSGSTEGLRLQPTAYILSTIGWTNVRDLNGSIPLQAPVVYFAEGFQAAAELLAVDASLPVTSIAPFAAAPPVAGLGDAQLLLYLGG